MSSRRTPGPISPVDALHKEGLDDLSILQDAVVMGPGFRRDDDINFETYPDQM